MQFSIDTSMFLILLADLNSNLVNSQIKFDKNADVALLNVKNNILSITFPENERFSYPIISGENGELWLNMLQIQSMRKKLSIMTGILNFNTKSINYCEIKSDNKKFKFIINSIENEENIDLVEYSNFFINEDLFVTSIINRLNNGSKNLILYGSPGTGKTYTVIKIAKRFIRNIILEKKFKLNLSEHKDLQDILYGFELQELIALEMYLSKETKLKASEILTNNFMSKFVYLKDKSCLDIERIFAVLNVYSKNRQHNLFVNLFNGNYTD